MIIKSEASTSFKPHPEGIHSAVCFGVFDLGLVDTEYQGQVTKKHKLRLGFASECKTEEGTSATIFKTFTASLHPKSRLAEFLGKWRGRPVQPGETIDLSKLVGASCTLVISHAEYKGRQYASIDAISKPTKKLAIPPDIDVEAIRQRIAEYRAKDTAPVASVATATPAPTPAAAPAPGPIHKSPAPSPAQSVPEFDPEVGF